MKMADVQKKAKALGLAPNKKTKKVDLVRSIQTAEGNTPCYATGVVDCPYLDCCFRDDCSSASSP